MCRTIPVGRSIQGYPSQLYLNLIISPYPSSQSLMACMTASVVMMFRPGTKRILVSRYTDAVEGTGFINPDGSREAVLLNRADKPCFGVTDHSLTVP